MYTIARRLEVPVCPRIHPTIWLSSSDTKNIRSASPRCAIEKIDARGRPSGVRSSPAGSSGSPFEPLLEPWRRQDAVQLQRQVEAILLREERLQIEHAELVERRGLHEMDQRGKVEAPAVLPRAREQRRQQRVLAASRRGVDAGKRQHARGCGAGAVPHEFEVLPLLRPGGVERTQHRNGQPRAAPRRVDREVGGCPEALNAGRVLPPVGQPPRPGLSLVRGVLLRFPSGAAGFVLVDPGPELRGREIGEGQQEVPKVPFGIDRDHGDAVDECFFEEPDAEARLAGTRHAHAHGMRHEVARVVQYGRLEPCAASDVVFTTEVEEPELFEVPHGVYRNLVQLFASRGVRPVVTRGGPAEKR